MTDLQATRPPRRVTRIGGLPDPWAWPPSEAQHSDNTFGNRWDDPEGVYRVVYACSQLEGAYVEVLSRFRPDPAVLAGLAEIDGPDAEYEAGVVPATWLETRAIGEATLRGVYADIGHVQSLTYLRTIMASRLIHTRVVRPVGIEPATFGFEVHLRARWLPRVADDLLENQADTGRPVVARWASSAPVAAQFPHTDPSPPAPQKQRALALHADAQGAVPPSLLDSR
jgi:hypothetical protein